MPGKSIDRFWDIRASADEAPELIFYGDISSYSWWGDEVTPQAFDKELRALGDVPELTVRINSPGGDPIAATAIYNRLKAHKANVTVIIDGWAASAATIIAMAGDVIQIPKNGVFMVHDPKVGAYGYLGASDLENLSQELAVIKQSIINTYAAKTGLDTEEIAAIMTDETWYSGETAVESGFCDELLEDEVEIKAENASRVFVNSVRVDLDRFDSVPPGVTKSILRNCGKSSANHFFNTKNESEVNDLEIKTVGDLRAAYPELVQELENSAVTAERERIQGIEELALDGFDDIVAAAKFEKPISAAEAAVQIVAKQKAQGHQFLKDRADDVAGSGVSGVAGSGSESGDAGAQEALDSALDEAFGARKGE